MQKQQDKTWDPRIGVIDDHLDSPPDYSDTLKTALFYRVRHLDEASIIGVDIDNGEMISIVGEKKNRKTTVALNFVRNWCLQADRLRGRKILWETLESGQTPQKIKQQLICMEATAYMIEQLYGGIDKLPRTKFGMDEYVHPDVLLHKRDPAYGDTTTPLFCLSREYAMAATRTPLQHEAIKEARRRVARWPLIIYGAPSRQGRTKALEIPNGMSGKHLLEECLPYKRWIAAAKDHNVGIIVPDHTNAYIASNDYDRQQKSITHGSAVVSELGVVMVAICQPSRGGLKEGGLDVRGGDRWPEESQVVIHVRYAQNSSFVKMSCGNARGAPFPDIYVPIEKSSGLLLPDSFPVVKGVVL